MAMSVLPVIIGNAPGGPRTYNNNSSIGSNGYNGGAPVKVSSIASVHAHYNLEFDDDSNQSYVSSCPRMCGILIIIIIMICYEIVCCVYHHLVHHHHHHHHRRHHY